MSGGASGLLAEHGGEVLAGLEPAGERDVGDTQFGAGRQEAFGGLDAALGEESGRREVGDPTAVIGKRGAAESALTGHVRKGPGLIEVVWEGGEKHLDRPAGGGEVGVEFGIAFFEQFAEGDEKLVDVQLESGMDEVWVRRLD